MGRQRVQGALARQPLLLFVFLQHQQAVGADLAVGADAEDLTVLAPAPLRIVGIPAASEASVARASRGPLGRLLLPPHLRPISILKALSAHLRFVRFIEAFETVVSSLLNNSTKLSEILSRLGIIKSLLGVSTE